MVKRPTGSGGEPSSPNCGASAGVKARQLTPSESFKIKDLDKFYRPRQAQCVTFPAQIKSQQTGLFQRNGTFYLCFIILQRQRYLFNGRSRIVISLNTSSKREASAHAVALRAQLLNPEASTHLLIRPAKPTPDIKPSFTVSSLLAEWQAIKKPSQDTYRACELALEGLLEMLKVPDLDLSALSSKFGQQYSAHMVKSSKSCKSRKTAHGKLTWIKSLLNFASDGLELILKNSWRGCHGMPSVTTSQLTLKQ